MFNKIARFDSQISNESTSQLPIVRDRVTCKISTSDLVEIVEKASTISERLDSARFTPNNSEANQQLINSHLEKWCQVATKGNQEKFAKRLAWDNLDIATISPALGKASLKEQYNLPSWVKTLRQAMEFASNIAPEILASQDSQQPRYFDPETPLPFEEVVFPFVEVARLKLIEQNINSYQVLSEKACIQLERNLLKRLSGLFASPLDLEFSLFRAYQGSQLTRLIKQLQNNSSRQQYTEFTRGLLKDGLLTFFKEYSVLARLVATTIDFWVDTVSEFLSRLTADWNKIQQTFQQDRELGEIVAIESGLSDPHNCGRSVIIVKFVSDLKLVYKPKNLSLEQTYFELLHWIDKRQEIIPSFKVLKIINSLTHGWIEFVEALPCQDNEAVKRYYQRAGALLCLVYVLRGTDFHSENLIACGEQPVLIDLETLLHHRTWVEENNEEAQSIAYEKLRDSVAATALLPGLSTIRTGQTGELEIDISGLGGFKNDRTARVLKWDCINTDGMKKVEQEVEISSDKDKNQPFGKDLELSLDNHSEILINGFRQMHQFLVQHREDLLAPSSPITNFSGHKVRLVLRNTSLYATILQNSLNYKCLRDGVERSIELDILSRGFIHSEEKHPSWEIVKPEKQALEQLDIPYCTAYSDSISITLNSEVVIENFLHSSSYNDVFSRLQTLNDVDLEEQISVIRSAFYSCQPEEELSLLVASSDRNLILEKITTISDEAILQQAIEIAEELEQQAIYGTDNSVAWLGSNYNLKSQRFQLHPLTYRLYDGYCGISLFLAALAKTTGNQKYASFALDSLSSFRKILQKQDSELQAKITANLGIGGTTGLASIVYTFVRIAEFLDKTKLIEEAQQIASWMQIDESVVEPKLSIFDGVAGTILSLLSLYKTTKKPEILEQATTWGKYLLERQENIDTDSKIWLDSTGKPLTGFFQGIAGISYALLCLYAVNQEACFLTAAIEAIAYEQNYLSQINSYQGENIVPSLTNWCDGLPGIALARLGSLNILDTSSIRQELETILPNIQRSQIQPLDNLCCGNFAELEVLLLAANKLDNSAYLETSRHKIAQVLSRRDRLEAFQLLPNLPKEVFVPGFSQGIAGVGYGLLRFLYPDKLPSVLLWQ